MLVTLNSLRRFLNDSGCIEARVLEDAGSSSIFIEFQCAQRSGDGCRAVLAVDRQARSGGFRRRLRRALDVDGCRESQIKTRLAEVAQCR